MLLVALLVACTSGYRPMPSSVYIDEEYTGFEQLTSGLQTTEVNLLYITDRLWDEDADGGPMQHIFCKGHNPPGGLIAVNSESSQG